MFYQIEHDDPTLLYGRVFLAWMGHVHDGAAIAVHAIARDPTLKWAGRCLWKTVSLCNTFRTDAREALSVVTCQTPFELRWKDDHLVMCSTSLGIWTPELRSTLPRFKVRTSLDRRFCILHQMKPPHTAMMGTATPML